MEHRPSIGRRYFTTALGFEERKQVGVDRVRLRGWHAVRGVLVGLERSVFEKLRRQRPGIRSVVPNPLPLRASLLALLDF